MLWQMITEKICLEYHHTASSVVTMFMLTMCVLHSQKTGIIAVRFSRNSIAYASEFSEYLGRNIHLVLIPINTFLLTTSLWITQYYYACWLFAQDRFRITSKYWGTIWLLNICLVLISRRLYYIDTTLSTRVFRITKKF